MEEQKFTLVPESISSLFTEYQIEFLSSGFDLKYLPTFADQPDPTYITGWWWEVRDKHGASVCEAKKDLYDALHNAMLSTGWLTSEVQRYAACTSE